ncbi:tellurite resistance TerB family protein [Phyllobacterium bourgognense]|uniref:Uncharacterized membrane protein YebE (DUF533 family) n=1 Tax=Phyllobacterium bourgognense TaxID=314236 RepID=A0A368Z4C9_9HYPH|nr:tellurite resistance TerB family protein [Phyllobacterium bourgognense]RCW87313.1 uncharacterized membrane protein YebE (DUF533 family) [Phyllobacterium bourgognense]
MASSQSVLEQMLQAALQGGGLRAGSGTNTPSQPAPGGPGNLSDILGSLLGGSPAAGAGGATMGRSVPAGNGGLGDILGSLLGGAAVGNGASTGSVPTRSPQPQAQMPQKAGTNDLVRYGGMAVLGVLAYQTFKRYQAQQAGESGVKSPDAAAVVPPADNGFHPAQAPGGADALSGVFVKAMVAAAQADGVIDEDEQRNLAGRLDQLGISSADRRGLAEQLTTPVDLREILNAATSPEVALQIYMASVLAIAADTPAERNYLDGLARALKIDPRLKVQVEQTLGRA